MNNYNQDTFLLNNKIYNNNNNILIEIIQNLQQIINYSKDNIIIKRISDIIIKMNFVINENRKNYELIRNDIAKLFQQMNKNFYQINKNFNELKVNNNININNQEIKYNDGCRYVGQVLNGIREGKGILYYPNGDIYEGEWKNDKKDGKGIYYYNREPWKGDRYEGEWKNGKQEGKGIYYYANGNREMGDYHNDNPIGRHAILTKNGEILSKDY